MVPIVYLLFMAFTSPRQIWAGRGPETNLMGGNNELPSNHRSRIHHSHMFHLEPRAIISSVLSDVRRQALTKNSEEVSLMDIDVSSNQLGDNESVFLMEELLSLLKSKVEKAQDSQSETKVHLSIKLALVMNKLTPAGASRLFDLIIGNHDDRMETRKKMENKSDSVLAMDDSFALSTNNDTEGLNNETSDATNDTNHLEGQTSADTPHDTSIPDVLIDELDLSFNDIGGHGIHFPNVQLLDSTRKLFEGDGAAFVPRVLSLENCGIGPAFCRGIGRGILNAFERKNNGTSNLSYRPSVLRIGGNNDIGDAGAVALAAALRMAVENDDTGVLNELDLSSCNVGDAGAEALALALSSNPGCLIRLDLSNNKITNAGSKALGRALVDASHSSGAVLEQIILDNNVGISDDGAAALAEAMALGAAKFISMRSCSVRARGTAAFGKALVSLASRNNCDESDHYHVDLSGNHFGTLKMKKKKGAMYSATLIRDRASTNIKFIGKTLKGAAKRWGSETMGIMADSDDEELMGGLIDDEEIISDKLQSCGGLSFAGEILNSDEHALSQKKEGAYSPKIYIGMRQCCLADGAIDALSASIVSAKNIDISVDISMNSVEENIVDALKNAKKDSKLLVSMAQRHMDFLDRIADARHRQLEAAEASATRSQELGGTLFDDDDDIYNEGFDYDPDDDFD